MADEHNEDGNGDWKSWSKYVLKELSRMHKLQEKFNEQQTKICVEIGMLKVKSGMWGAIGALIPITMFFVYQLLKK